MFHTSYSRCVRTDFRAPGLSLRNLVLGRSRGGVLVIDDPVQAQGRKSLSEVRRDGKMVEVDQLRRPKVRHEELRTNAWAAGGKNPQALRVRSETGNGNVFTDMDL